MERALPTKGVLRNVQPVTRGPKILYDNRQVSWLTVLCADRPSRLLSGIFCSAPPDYSDEFAQDFHLFPFSPDQKFLIRHPLLLYSTIFSYSTLRFKTQEI